MGPQGRKVRARCGDKAPTLQQLSKGGRKFQRERGKEGGGERKGEKEKREEEQAVKTHSQV